ncbi:MAG TPA: glycosyltransferase [Phycisphaerales bacterium]|nr:glycosyltransferase [Phycisphaerales bacterium]
MPKLTYVIPAYNAEATLDQTVGSVLRQTERSVAAVIVDDGSTDGTRHVAGALLGKRVRLVSRENGGLAAARNTGWAALDSPCVCFLDADDVVAPTHARRMLAALDDADAVACSYEFVGPGLDSLGWRAPVLAGDTAHERLIEVNRLAVGGVVLRSDTARTLLGGRGFEEALPVHEDWELFLRLCRAGARWAAPVEDPLFQYRLRAGSLSDGLDRMWRVGLEVIARHARGGVERDRCTRRWHVRAAARAVAAGSHADLAAAMACVGELCEEDLPTLVGTLRWALARSEFVGPPSWAARMPAWTDRTRAMLDGYPFGRRAAERLANGPHRWRELVERARGMLSPGQALVVYGFGRNGREALRAAAEAGLRVAVIDDDPRAIGKVPAITLDDLTPDHVVLVTPEDRTGIMAKLERRGVSRIVLPDAA